MRLELSRLSNRDCYPECLLPLLADMDNAFLSMPVLSMAGCLMGVFLVAVMSFGLVMVLCPLRPLRMVMVVMPVRVTCRLC